MEVLCSSEPLVTIHSSILKMETVYFFEMLGSAYKTKRCMNVSNSGDSTIQKDTECMLEHIWGNKNLNTLRGMTVFGDISINGRIILKIREMGCEGLDWVQLSLRMWSSGFHKRETISWPNNSLPDPEEDIFSKKFVAGFSNAFKHLVALFTVSSKPPTECI